jgi:hypothetical protein
MIWGTIIGTTSNIMSGSHGHNIKGEKKKPDIKEYLPGNSNYRIQK